MRGRVAVSVVDQYRHKLGHVDYGMLELSTWMHHFTGTAACEQLCYRTEARGLVVTVSLCTFQAPFKPWAASTMAPALVDQA